MTLYVNRHRTQFDGTAKARSNCTPTSGANGADASTGGRVSKSGGQVRALVRTAEETNPANPGWSLPDLDIAMARLGVPFEPRSNEGWTGVTRALDAGYYVVLQGDSEVFGNATCSGAYDGDHAIGVHPRYRVGEHWIDDPICTAGRWESDTILRAYAVRLHASVLFGVFLTRVPSILWGSDVPAANRAVDPLGARVAAAVREAGHDYGTLVNTRDLKAAMKRAGHNYGQVVDPSDIRWLLDWAARH